MIGSDSPGRVVVEEVDGVDADGLAEDVSGEEDVVEVDVVGDDGGGAGLEAGGIEGTPVAVVNMVASTPVVAGAPIVGGRAEEKAFEPGVS